MNARRPTPIALPAGLSCIDRRPGHEVVFAEMFDARKNGAARLMDQARRLYLASVPGGIELPAWESLGAATVRQWVNVAQEAKAIHCGGER